MKLLLKSGSINYATVIVSHMETKYCNVMTDECGVPISHVSLHMCLLVRMLISRTTRPNFTEFYLHVIYDYNPV